LKLLGIDNGLEGALALLDTESGEVLVADTKLDPFREIDCHWIFTLLTDWEPDHACIEICHNNNGLVERGGYYIGICRLLQIPVLKADVRSWKRKVLGTSTNDKTLSVTTCQRLFPQADIDRPTPKGKRVNKDHNRAEAVLLSHYLQTTLSP
jgi:hypothetical protein